MSFKGIKKTIVRAPQNFRQKMNMGEVTSDPVYADAERRFKELEMETKKLSDESKRYFSSVNGMLDYQTDFSKAIEEIYKPISGRLSDPNSAVPEDNPEGIKAAEQYREVVKELKETLKPDLELIEKRIVNPAQELLQVINLIRKMATKREHKQVDLDRHKRTYKKYEEKKERSVKDEEKMYNAEVEVQMAQEEYDYFNDLLKQELPILFQMQADFIKPLFVSFYYMQLNIFYTLFNRMEELKIPYFDLSTDIIESYQRKKGNIEEQTDAIGITHFRVANAKNKLEATKRRHAMMNANGPEKYGAGSEQLPAYTPGGGQPQYGDYKSPDGPGGATQPYGGYNQPAGYGSPQSSVAPVYSPTSGYGSPQASVAPVYSPPGGYASPQQTAAPSYPTAGGYGQTPTPLPTSYGANPAYAAPGQSHVSPPPITPVSAPSAQMCTALYDYTAQAQGDLTFTAGAVIEVIDKTSDANGWWTGRYNGQTGVFPGNYVKLN